MTEFVVLINFMLGGALLVILLPASVFFLEILCGLLGRRDPVTLQGERPRVTVLIPARNEATLIARVIRSIAPQLKVWDRLLVIADNCSDRTAEVAAEAGANVIVRTDLARRSKGYALDYGGATFRATHLILSSSWMPIAGWRVMSWIASHIFAFERTVRFKPCN